MAITISGQNNNDKILASDGVLDSISGFSVVGVMTAANFDVTGKTTTGHLNIGNNIQIGNAGIITATTFVGNLTGNVNATSNLLLQIGGSEKFRVASSGQLGIGGANYGTSGQVLTSGGSGSAATWSTIASDKITESNAEAEVYDVGSNTSRFTVKTEGSERLRVSADGNVTVGAAVTISPVGNINATGIITATSFSGSGANLTSLPAANLTGTLPAISGANLTSLPAQATIANNADNRVITGGSGVNLNGEGDLTFDGNQLYIDCNNYSEPILINSTQSSVRATIRQTNDANANSGLTIQKRHSSLHPANYWYGDIQFQGWDGSGYHRAGLIECVAEGTPANDNMPGNLRFSTNPGAAGQTERFRITAGGQLRLMEGNSVKMSVYNDGAQNFITSNSGQEIKISCGNGNSNGIEFWDYTGTNKRCQIDGQGIKFGTDTADANGLNDYEEGTYVPTTNSGLTLQGSYDIFAYIKVGRMCTVRGLFYPNNNPSGSGGMTMSLPFASYNYSQIAGAGGSGVMYRSISGADAGVAVYIPDNTSSAQFYKNGSNGGSWSAVTNNNWGSAMEIYVDFTYFTV